MKSITLSADENLLESAQALARDRNTTLDAAFNSWLADYVARRTNVEEIKKLYRELAYVDAGGKYTRDEMNER